MVEQSTEYTLAMDRAHRFGRILVDITRWDVGQTLMRAEVVVKKLGVREAQRRLELI